MSARMYRPIRTCADVTRLLAEGAAERYDLEAKIEVRPERGENGREKQIEFVRDVVQFANTDGGTILVGVPELTSEFGRKVLGKPRYLKDCDVRRDWMLTALRNFAAPSTISVDIVDILFPEGALTAVNVPPHPGTVFVWDDQSIQCVVRTDNRKKYLNPEEALRHVTDIGRASKFALERTLTKVVPSREVELASGLWTFAWDTNAGIIESNDGWGGHREILVRVPADLARLTIGATHEQVFELQDDRKAVNIPYSLVRDVWLTVESRLGLLLEARLVRNNGNLEIQAP